MNTDLLSALVIGGAAYLLIGGVARIGRNRRGRRRG